MKEYVDLFVQYVVVNGVCAAAGLLWNDLNVPDVAAGCFRLFSD